MKNNDVKNILYQYKLLLREIENQQERLERLNALMYSAKSPSLSADTRGGGAGDKLLVYMAKKETLEVEIAKLHTQEKAMREKIESYIAELDNPDARAVIRMRYIDCEEWPTVTELLFKDKYDYKGNYELYQNKTFKLHGAALTEIGKQIKKEKTSATN